MTTAATRATLRGARARASATPTAAPAAATAPSTAEALACVACGVRTARSQDVGAGCMGATAPRPGARSLLADHAQQVRHCSGRSVRGVNGSWSVGLETGAGQGRGYTGGAVLTSCAAWQMWTARCRVKRGQICAPHRVGWVGWVSGGLGCRQCSAESLHSPFRTCLRASAACSTARLQGRRSVM